MSAPPSNVGNTAFRLTSMGAVASRRIPAQSTVGVFIYYQWDVVGVLTRDLAIGVAHTILNANCQLFTSPGDPTTVYLRSMREIHQGDRLLLDYRRAPWWVSIPPRPMRLFVPDFILSPRFHIGPSDIHGFGVIASVPLAVGVAVGPVIDFHWWFLPIVTREFGRHINHSGDATARLECRHDSWWAVTTVTLAKGDEITLDYRQLPWYCAGEPQNAGVKRD